MRFRSYRHILKIVTLSCCDSVTIFIVHESFTILPEIPPDEMFFILFQHFINRLHQ